MATLNELGRNSASLTYGPYGTGQDLWPTLVAVDAWIRNDTWQGYVTTTGTSVTGVGTIFTTQARAGDLITVANQVRTIQSVNSDLSLTVTSAFTATVSLPSAIKVINTNTSISNAANTGLTGTALATIRNSTSGTVAVTNGSAIVTGVGTYFLSDGTNAVTTVQLAGTVSIDTSGNITGVGTSFVSGQGIAPAGQNGLYPGDCLVITQNGASYYVVVGSVISDTQATTTVATIPTLTSTGGVAINPGSSIFKATNGVIGRYININGRIRQITGIASNTSLTVNYPMDFTDSNLRYRTYPRGTISNATAAGGTFYGATITTGTGLILQVGGTVTGSIIPGAVLTATTGISSGTTIVNQLFGTTGTQVVSPVITFAGIGNNTATVASTASIAVGQLLAGNGITLAGVQPSTYVTAISPTGNIVSFNNTFTSSITSVNGYFFTPGGAGSYTTNNTTTISAGAITWSSVQLTGGNFFWDIVSGDTVWIGDEARNIYFANSGLQGQNGATNAYLIDYSGYSGQAVGIIRQPVFGIPYKRDDTYINGNGTNFTNELRVGDELIIDGTEVQVTQIVSASQFRINMDFTHYTGGSTIWKKQKLHGWTMEGTREGGPGTSGKWFQSTYLSTANGSVAAGTVYATGATTIQVAAAPTANATAAYQFIKIQGAGGPPLPMTGQILGQASSTTVNGINTLFTQQLHVGAEIIVAGQYLTVTAITSDTQMTVSSNLVLVNTSPFYRTVPLYTYITTAITGAGPYTITLGTPLKNNVYSTAANAPIVYFLATGGDFIEYVYSAPNTTAAEGTITQFNTSYDRKYFGFRFWPLFQSTMTNPTATATISTANGAYATPVYERWAAAYGLANGIGINMSDLSGGQMVQGTAASGSTFTVTQPITGSFNNLTQIQTSAWTSAAATQLSGGSATLGIAGSTYSTINGATVGASSIVVGGMNGVYDVTGMTQVSGGFLYMFGNRRWFVVQGKTFANIQTQWQGVIEFERAQPEDTGTGLGTVGGVSYLTSNIGGTQLAQGSPTPTNTTAVGFSQSLQYIPGVAPWPCYAYFNGNRFPTGHQQFTTLPVASGYPIHGGLFSTPRVRNSAGDLVGINAHIYSAATITTGRWGHVIEFGATGAYLSVGTPSSSGLVAQQGTVNQTNEANSIPQIHLGQIVPVYTNVYNSKRFMFSPVVVLGPAYDPDVRGRIYGLKVIPSNLGSLMDTVSILVNAEYFYDNTQATATDHWVVGTPPTAPGSGALSGQQVVSTYRFTTTSNAVSGPQQSWRSLEDTSYQANNSITQFTNNFRMAFPA
jgi:hypothetical protein